jgi:hypothetical protein
VALTFTAVALFVLVASASIGVFPPLTIGAVLPAVATGMWLVGVPPPPRRLRAVGWTLVAASVATGVTLITGL